VTFTGPWHGSVYVGPGWKHWNVEQNEACGKTDRVAVSHQGSTGLYATWSEVSWVTHSARTPKACPARETPASRARVRRIGIDHTALHGPVGHKPCNVTRLSDIDLREARDQHDLAPRAGRHYPPVIVCRIGSSGSVV